MPIFGMNFAKIGRNPVMKTPSGGSTPTDRLEAA
jgi:hypothetical protein